MEQSAFKDEGNAELKGKVPLNLDSDINQLYDSQKKFTEFVQTLGENGNVPLTEANFRYSKEIQQGYFTHTQITRLVSTRVEKYFPYYPE